MTSPETLLRDACRDIALAGSEVARLAALRAGATKLATPVRHGLADRSEIVDALWEQSVSTGLVEAVGEGTVTAAISAGLEDFGDETNLVDDDARANGHQHHLAPPQAAIHATPYVWCDPSTIPRREWLYGRYLIRGQVSLTIAPGAVGKSTLIAEESLAMVTGRQLLHDVPYGRSRVWLWNGEDPKDELQRRIQATCLHYGITRDEFEGRLFVDSGRNTEIVIARQERNGVIVAEPVVDALVETIRLNQIDVVRIDPFVSCHQVPENDNGAIDRVAKTYARIASETGCAIELAHHARKTGGAAIEVEDARGAVALIAAARAARVLNTMSEDEAARAGVENRYAHVRIDDAKANLAPRDGKAKWLRFVSVSLGNGDPTSLADTSDDMGVVEPWAWPDALAGVTGADFERAASAIRDGRWRESPQARDWVGVPVAQALGLDLGRRADKARVVTLVRTWLAAGSLVTVEGLDRKRMPRTYVEVVPDEQDTE